jgi:hypothetical protein
VHGIAQVRHSSNRGACDSVGSFDDGDQRGPARRLPLHVRSYVGFRDDEHYDFHGQELTGAVTLRPVRSAESERRNPAYQLFLGAPSRTRTDTWRIKVWQCGLP